MNNLKQPFCRWLSWGWGCQGEDEAIEQTAEYQTATVQTFDTTLLSRALDNVMSLTSREIVLVQEPQTMHYIDITSQCTEPDYLCPPSPDNSTALAIDHSNHMSDQDEENRTFKHSLHKSPPLGGRTAKAAPQKGKGSESKVKGISAHSWTTHLMYTLVFVAPPHGSHYNQLVTLNIRGLRNQWKVGILSQWYCSHEVSTLCLQETYLCDNERAIVTGLFPILWSFSWCYSLLWSGYYGVYQGSIFPSFSRHDRRRLLSLEIRIDNLRFQVVNVYALTAVAERLAFLNKIDRVLNQSHVDHLVLCRDFSEIMNYQANRKTSSTWSYPVSSSWLLNSVVSWHSNWCLPWLSSYNTRVHLEQCLRQLFIMIDNMFISASLSSLCKRCDLLPGPFSCHLSPSPSTLSFPIPPPNSTITTEYVNDTTCSVSSDTEWPNTGWGSWSLCLSVWL